MAKQILVDEVTSALNNRTQDFELRFSDLENTTRIDTLNNASNTNPSRLLLTKKITSFPISYIKAFHIALFVEIGSSAAAAVSILSENHFSVIRLEVREQICRFLHKECEAWWRESETKAM